MDALIAKLPQLIVGVPILLIAIALGLASTWLIRKIYNKIFSNPTFPDAVSHALVSTVMFVPGWIIMLFGALTALGIFNFRMFPPDMLLQHLRFIFVSGLVLYFVNAWRKARA